MNGVQLFVQELQRQGVTFIATLCGHGLNDIDKACEEASIRLIDVRNEQAAGYIAEVSGRLTRRVGVCAVSSGVAHANAMTGVVNAFFDGAPMLLISGSGSTETMGMGHFQDLDHIALSSPVCKYARIIDCVERIPQIVHEAFSYALSGRPGPVHLTFPMNIQEMEVDIEKIIKVAAPPRIESPKIFADIEQIEIVLNLLSKARKPLLIAGSGVFYSNGEEALSTFVNEAAIPVVVPIWDRGPVPKSIAQYMGVIGADTGDAPLLSSADLILMFGAAFDYRVGYLQPPAVRKDVQIVRVDSDPTQLQQGIGSHFSIQADPSSALKQLTEVFKLQSAAPYTKWLNEAISLKTDLKKQVLQKREKNNEKLHYLDVLEAIEAVLTDDTILLVDGGNIGQWFHKVFDDRYPGHWVTCGASGVIGFGIPGAMAARVIYPDRPIILLTGDGSIGFSIMELDSANRQGLGFVVLLADDEAWGITYSNQTEKYGHAITSKLGHIKFNLVAEGLGANSSKINNAKELVPALNSALKDKKRPSLIHIPVSTRNPTLERG